MIEYAEMKKYGHCFKFVKFGACTRKFCKFIHVNRNSSYPNHSNFMFGKSKTDIGKDRTFSTPRKTFRSGDGQRKQHGRPICFNFKNKGFCRYGSQCKYSHVFNSRSAGRTDFNQRFTSAREERSNNFNYNTESSIVDGSFLGEVRSLLDSMKTMAESHKQGNPVVFIVPQYQNVPVVSQVPVTNQEHQPWLPQHTHTHTHTHTHRSRAAVSDSKRNPKKKIRRGRKPGKTKNQIANSGISSFLYANVNGYRSKKESINQIIEEHDIDVIMLNETKVYSKSAIKIKGFQSFPVVRNKNKGGGAFIGVRHGLCEPIMIDCGDNAEFLTVRLCNGVKGMQIILAYGPQENDTEETLNSFHTNLSVQLEVAFLNGDSVILLGDFNAKLGNGIINQDAHAMSKSGKMLFSLFQKYNLCLLYSSDICQGTFTRIQQCNKRIETSVFDYVFVSDDLQQHMVSMVIEEQKQFTPWRVV